MPVLERGVAQGVVRKVAKGTAFRVGDGHNGGATALGLGDEGHGHAREAARVRSDYQAVPLCEMAGHRCRLLARWRATERAHDPEVRGEHPSKVVVLHGAKEGDVVCAEDGIGGLGERIAVQRVPHLVDGQLVDAGNALERLVCRRTCLKGEVDVYVRPLGLLLLESGCSHQKVVAVVLPSRIAGLFGKAHERGLGGVGARGDLTHGHPSDAGSLAQQEVGDLLDRARHAERRLACKVDGSVLVVTHGPPPSLPRR